MKRFYNFTLATKLVISLGAVLILTVTTDLAAINRMGSLNRAATELSQSWMPRIESILMVRSDLGDLRRWELAILLTSKESIRASMKKNMVHAIETLKADSAKYTALVTGQDDKAKYTAFVALLTRFMVEHEKMLDLSQQDKRDDTLAILQGESARLFKEMSEQLDLIVKADLQSGKQASQTADDQYNASRVWVLALLAADIALGIGLAVWISAIISRPLKQAVAVARRVAAGDLTASIPVESIDETGQLMQALKDMNGSLKHIVGQVRGSTETIAAASAEIALGNLDLSARTEQQASSLEETASSMEEFTSTVRQNADNARQANQLALSASDVATEGGRVIGQVVDTMASINSSSQKIVDVIGVIDSIAFQTNILALNAAVEAAHAGDQGRGFAVVAHEVRNLAQRCAEAAREIKGLINESVTDIGAGTALVAQAGATMANVVESIGRVTRFMGDIAVASQEQSQGIEQINQAISQMDQVTQQNATLVEEAAAAAESMQSQAAALSGIVSVFKIGAGDDAASSAKAATKPGRAGSRAQRPAAQLLPA